MRRYRTRIREIGQHLFSSLSLLAAILLLVAACGTSGDADDDGVASLGMPTVTSDATEQAGEGDVEQAMLDYAACMREQGIDIPDPVGSRSGGPNVQSETNEDDSGRASSGDEDPEEFEAAHQTCKSHIEGLNIEGPSLSDSNSPENARMEQWAQCMQDHGVDVPDPSIGPEDVQSDAAEPAEMPDPESPEFKQAAEECDPILGTIDGEGQ